MLTGYIVTWIDSDWHIKKSYLTTSTSQENAGRVLDPFPQ